MAKYGVTCTMILNGYVEVDAENEEDAILNAERMFDKKSPTDEIAHEGYCGEVYFDFGEVTADFADKI